MSRLFLVSNRLPVSVSVSNGDVRVVPSSGGLATGLAKPHEAGGGTWIGWPGPTWSLDAPARAALDAQLAEKRLSPVHLGADEVAAYYDEVSNALLWPLFHSLVEQIPLGVSQWDVYRTVNARFADEIARLVRPGDRVWIHDYHLALVPALLRRRVPGVRIGFFLHIPFPPPAVLRLLPKREELLRGLLGADLIGFHTPSYVRNFAGSVLRILGHEMRIDAIEVGEREVRVRSFPMGVDAEDFEDLGEDSDVRARVDEIRANDDCRLLVGVDRLDYTKGIPRRLLAYERMLHAHPELCGKVRLVQVGVPTRGGTEAYRDFREQVDSHVGRIQGELGTATWSPVLHLHRSFPRLDVAALYRAADVMLVTPIRDGMNLVAKEFVATRTDEDGVLVLSEFAGAAGELDGALLVNPYDVAASAETYARALSMPREERRERMRLLRRRVLAADVHGWVEAFLAALEPPVDSITLRERREIDVAEVVHRRIAAAPEIVLLLDYDGTLVPFADRPELAVPDEELVALLALLAERPRTRVHLVSGRARTDLERWFGALDVGLHAEHGRWSRWTRGEAWRLTGPTSLPYASRIATILEDYAARTPGTFVERKSAGLAWHWRQANPLFGRHQANELRLHLAEVLSNLPVEVLPGEHVVEVRPHGIDKSTIVPGALARAGDGALAIAIGDDRTDEDLFCALGPEHVSVHVGPRASAVELHVDGPTDVRRLLASIVEPSARR